MNEKQNTARLGHAIIRGCDCNACRVYRAFVQQSVDTIVQKIDRDIMALLPAEEAAS